MTLFSQLYNSSDAILELFPFSLPSYIKIFLSFKLLSTVSVLIFFELMLTGLSQVLLAVVLEQTCCVPLWKGS